MTQSIISSLLFIGWFMDEFHFEPVARGHYDHRDGWADGRNCVNGEGCNTYALKLNYAYVAGERWNRFVGK